MTSPNFQHSGFGLSPHPFFSDVNSLFSPGVHQNYEVSRKKKKKKRRWDWKSLSKTKLMPLCQSIFQDSFQELKSGVKFCIDCIISKNKWLITYEILRRTGKSKTKRWSLPSQPILRPPPPLCRRNSRLLRAAGFAAAALPTHTQLRDKSTPAMPRGVFYFH